MKEGTISIVSRSLVRFKVNTVVKKNDSKFKNPLKNHPISYQNEGSVKRMSSLNELIISAFRRLRVKCRVVKGGKFIGSKSNYIYIYTGTKVGFENLR